MPNATALPPMSIGLVGLKMAGALLFLLALILLAYWLLKRFGPRAGLRFAGHGDLEVVGRLALGPKKSIAVVRFLNKKLVIGVTETSINLLTEIDADHDQESDNHTENDFSSLLRHAGPDAADPGAGADSGGGPGSG